mgnify:CR=1 FL=1
MRGKMKNGIGLLLILIAISITGSFYLQKKGGYYVDEGMTLFGQTDNIMAASRRNPERAFRTS